MSAGPSDRIHLENSAPSGMDKIRANLRDDPQRLSTPCYVYDVDEVIRNYTDLKRSLGTPLVISLKANSCLELLFRYQHVAEDGIEVASLGELNTVVGGSRGPIYFNSPACDLAAMRAVIACRATLVVDSLAQLDALANLPRRDRIRPLVLRLNGGVINQFGGPRVRADHFGMDWETARDAIRRVRDLGLGVHGFHLFSGSYSFKRLGQAAVPVFHALVDAFRAETGQPPAFANLGGGFGERWREEAFDFAAYRQALVTGEQGVGFAHESGRGIFSSAGYFLTRVLYSKRLGKEWVVVCDGGISQNFLLCKTEGALRHHQVPELYLTGEEAREERGAPALVVGPSCSRDDVIARLPAEGPLPRPDDVLIFDYCGAYHHSYSVSRFLSLPEAVQYVV